MISGRFVVGGLINVVAILLPAIWPRATPFTWLSLAFLVGGVLLTRPWVPWTSEPAWLVLQLLEELRAEEGATVEFCCPNPDFNGQPNEVVLVVGSWTEWEEERFGGDTLVDALEAAKIAMSQRSVS